MGRNSVPSSRSGLPINVRGTSPIYHRGTSSGPRTNLSFHSTNQNVLLAGRSVPKPVTPSANVGPVSPVRGAVAGVGIGEARHFSVATRPGAKAQTLSARTIGGTSPLNLDNAQSVPAHQGTSVASENVSVGQAARDILKRKKLADAQAAAAVNWNWHGGSGTSGPGVGVGIK